MATFNAGIMLKSLAAMMDLHFTFLKRKSYELMENHLTVASVWFVFIAMKVPSDLIYSQFQYTEKCIDIVGRQYV